MRFALVVASVEFGAMAKTPNVKQNSNVSNRCDERFYTQRSIHSMSLFLGLNEDVVPPPGQPVIKEIRAYVTRAEGYGSSDVHDTPDTHWIMGQPPHHPPIGKQDVARFLTCPRTSSHLPASALPVPHPSILSALATDYRFYCCTRPAANPMTRFPKYAESRASWGVAKVPTVVVEVEQEDGLIGVGASCGGEAACFLIENHLAQFVEGQNVRNVSASWEH